VPEASEGQGLTNMDETYRINLAKTEFREAYNRGDVDQLLSVFMEDGFTDMSEGGPSFYGQEAREGLRLRSNKLFAEYSVVTDRDHQSPPQGKQIRSLLGATSAHAGLVSERRALIIVSWSRKPKGYRRSSNRDEPLRKVDSSKKL